MKSHVCAIGLRANPLRLLKVTLIVEPMQTLQPVMNHRKSFNLGTCMFPTIEIK